MAKQSLDLLKHFRKRKSDLYNMPSMSKFQPLARSSDTLDGMNENFVIMDELHGEKDRNLFKVMQQSMAARRQMHTRIILVDTSNTT